jgi:hypothetical protein
LFKKSRGEFKAYLAEVSSPLVEVDFLRDFDQRAAYFRQVCFEFPPAFLEQYTNYLLDALRPNHVALGVLEQSVVDDKGVLETLVLGEVGEALLLHKSHMVVMHPLPRNAEISEEVDFDQRAAYFRQVCRCEGGGA